MQCMHVSMYVNKYIHIYSIIYTCYATMYVCINTQIHCPRLSDDDDDDDDDDDAVDLFSLFQDLHGYSEREEEPMKWEFVRF